MFGEEDEVVRRDREKHPECGYSTQVEKQCGMNESNTKFTCETVKKVFRHCQNATPVVVLNRKTSDSEAGIFGGLFGHVEKKVKEIDQDQENGALSAEMNEIQKNLDVMMGQESVKSVIDLLKEVQKDFPGQGGNHLPKHPRVPKHDEHINRNSEKIIPFAEDYDRMMEEALGYSFPTDSEKSKRKGRASGAVREV